MTTTSAASPDPAASRLSGTLPVWNPEADDALVVREIRQETADVKTFVLAPRQPCVFRYQPGQFLTLDISGRRRERQPLLHHCLRPHPPAHHRDYREARARRAGVELPA